MADNKLQTLIEIFNERFFRIPDFQRGYSWEKEQLEDFWSDLINLKDDRVHYTGLLTVEPVDENKAKDIEQWHDDMWLFKKGLKAYYLIDGQQRMTTAIILINEILSILENDDDKIAYRNKSYWVDKFLFQEYDKSCLSYVFGYERDNPSDEYFRVKILNQISLTSDKVPEQTLYTYNLYKAKEFFSQKLASLSKEETEDIFSKVTTKLKFNLYEIDDDLDVYITFETMNNRGKALSTLELLKNRLIYLSTLLEEDENLKNRLRKNINEAWKTVYAYLGKNKDKKMDDDNFLRNHWIMYFKYDKSKSNALSKFLLNEKFTAQNVLILEKDSKEKVAYDDIDKYIKSLSVSVKSWFYIHNPSYSNFNSETKEWLFRLNRLGMSSFPPLIMAVINKCSEKENEILPFLKAIERFIFLVFRVTQRKSNTQRSHFYNLANSFYYDKDNISINDLVNEIRKLTFDKSDENGNKGWFDLNFFNSYIKDQYDKESGFYSWNGLKYFLYEYETYLKDQANGTEKVGWKQVSDRTKEDTIEHIYPQTATLDCWKINFSNLTDKDRAKILNSLGNLVLLSRSKNSELQNKCFDFKKLHQNKEGENTGFFNGSYSEIEVSSCDDWRPSNISKRGLDMLSFMEKRWDINFGDWDLEKKSLLRLDFLDDRD